MRVLWNKIKQFVKWLWQQLKDWRNLVILGVVVAVVSSEVWVPYLLGLLTGDAWWYAVGTACWVFWLGPFTPFWPLCIALTLGIRRVIDAISDRDREARPPRGSKWL